MAEKYIAGEAIDRGDLVRLDKNSGKLFKATPGLHTIGNLPVAAKVGDALEIDHSTSPPTIRNLT